jgi:3-hydroxyacyl-[acyl-carrier-protein] dehydratase
MIDTPPQTDTLSQIKAIMQRDLKLAPNAEIGDDTPLLGGNLDLDSIDVLLLLTSVEKAFGFKVNADTEAIKALHTLRTFARYVDERRAAAPGSCQRPALTAENWLAHLPHQPPFRFVSKFAILQPGQTGEGEWSVTGAEAFLAGHFPGRPIVPGVLIAEALGQVSGLLAASDSPMGNHALMLAEVKVKFHKPVLPPAAIVLHSHLTQTTGPIRQFQVQARVGEQVVADGAMALVTVGGNGSEGRA